MFDIGKSLLRLEQEKGIVVRFMIGHRFDLNASEFMADVFIVLALSFYLISAE